MAFYVMLTVFLFQKGSSESKKLGQKEAVDRDPRRSKNKKNSPWPVRKGGWVLSLYENSLSLAFLSLFLASFAWHAIGGIVNIAKRRLLTAAIPCLLANT